MLLIYQGGLGCEVHRGTVRLLKKNLVLSPFCAAVIEY